MFGRTGQLRRAASARQQARTIRSVLVTGPYLALASKDPGQRGLAMLGLCAFLAAYGMIFDWIYRGYVDLWFGTYGIEEDEDEE